MTILTSCTNSVFTTPTIAAAYFVNPASLITAVTSGTIASETVEVDDTVGVTLSLFDI
jgi:Gpi18-like mannosyltransferase